MKIELNGGEQWKDEFSHCFEKGKVNKMIKRLTMALGLVGMVATLTACGEKEMGIDATQYVTLPDYSAVETTSTKVEITQEAIDMVVENALQALAMNVEVIDRAVEEGDTVNIDFTGYIDGELFDGGSTNGAGFDLVIGSGNFIDGFEDGLIGAELGETRTLSLAFPEDYAYEGSGSEHLNGQAVEFEVTVNLITELEVPTLTDEIVPNLESTVSTIDEYYEFIRAGLEVEAQASHDSRLAAEVFAYIMANAEFTDIPEDMITYYVDLQEEIINSYVEAYGVTREEVLTSLIGQTEEEYQESAIQNANEMAQEYLLFKALGTVEGVAVTQSDFDEYAEENYAEVGAPSAEEYIAALGEQQVELSILAERLLPILAEKTVLVEEATVTE